MLTKIENGIEVECSPEEEAQIRADWGSNHTLPPPEYVLKRALAYPSIADQLDIIFHQGVDSWKVQIQAIKNQYPKRGDK